MRENQAPGGILFWFKKFDFDSVLITKTSSDESAADQQDVIR